MKWACLTNERFRIVMATTRKILRCRGQPRLEKRPRVVVSITLALSLHLPLSLSLSRRAEFLPPELNLLLLEIPPILLIDKHEVEVVCMQPQAAILSKDIQDIPAGA